MKHVAVFCAASLIAAPALADSKDKIEHIIIISLENHSFDNVFGNFPGAEGLEQARASAQVGKDGKAYTVLPPVRDTRQEAAEKYAAEGQQPGVDKRFPKDLPNAPFLIDKYVKNDEGTGDLTHRFYQEQDQIHGGKMDRFAAISEAGGLAMGYYDGSKFGLWEYARQYTLADHFFHAAFGGSFLNHMWLVCACTPKFDGAPKSMVMQLDKHGQMVKSGVVTPDGYAVNTVFAADGPRPVQLHDEKKLLPPVALPTIGDRLSEKNISWAWYSGGWNDAVSGHADKNFQFHHQPFAYFAAYGKDTQARKDHLKDEEDFLADLKNNTLPAVAFYKPNGEFNLHPSYANFQTGDKHITDILKQIEASKAWASTVVIVTFDENGGYWDHVAPPKVDRWGPGTRVPTLVISPLAKKGFVDHTVYDSTSILKLIEWRYGLKPLASRDTKANNMLNALALD